MDLAGDLLEQWSASSPEQCCAACGTRYPNSAEFSRMPAVNAPGAHTVVHNNLCPLSRRLCFEHDTAPQRMVSLAHNTRDPHSPRRHRHAICCWVSGGRLHFHVLAREGFCWRGLKFGRPAIDFRPFHEIPVYFILGLIHVYTIHVYNIEL